MSLEAHNVYVSKEGMELMVCAGGLLFTWFCELSCGMFHASENSGVQSFQWLARVLMVASREESESTSSHSLTLLPPLGCLSTSLASKNWFSSIMINKDDSIISGMVKNNDYGSEHPPRHFWPSQLKRMSYRCPALLRLSNTALTKSIRL